MIVQAEKKMFSYLVDPRFLCEITSKIELLLHALQTLFSVCNLPFLPIVVQKDDDSQRLDRCFVMSGRAVNVVMNSVPNVGYSEI